MAKATKVVRVGGFNLSTQSAALISQAQKGALAVIRKIFSKNEDGFAYLPSEGSSIFQDAIGSQLTNTSQQPIGLMLDVKKGVRYSDNTIPNLDFTQWAKTANVTGTTGNTFTSSGAGGCYLFSSLPNNTGTYRIRIKGTTTANFNIRTSASAVGVYTVYAGAFDVDMTNSLIANAPSPALYLALLQAGTVTVTSLSVQEVYGVHASQATSAARPLYIPKYIVGQNLISKSGWTNGTPANLAERLPDGSFKITNASSTEPRAGVTMPVVVGKRYEVTVDVETSSLAPVVIGTQTATFSRKDEIIFETVSASTRKTVKGSFVATENTAVLGAAMSAVTGAWAVLGDVTLKEVLAISKPKSVVFDGIDDSLTSTLAAEGEAYTVLRAVPDKGTEVAVSKVLPKTYVQNTNHAGLVAVKRSLTYLERKALVTEMDKLAGASSLQSLGYRCFNGNTGVIFDPSDLSTLYQDQEGKTVVTGANQPVSIMLDKSQNLALGDEMVKDPTFDQGATNYKVTNNDATHIVTFGTNTCRFQSDTTTPVMSLSIGLATPLKVGAWYVIDVDVPTYTGGMLKSDNFTRLNLNVVTKSGLNRTIAQATQTSLTFIRNAANTDVTMSRISIKELKGCHAYQDTSASRPLTVRHPSTGVRNIIPYTSDPSRWYVLLGGTGVTPTFTASQLAPDGSYNAVQVSLNKGNGTTLTDQSGVRFLGVTNFPDKSYVASIWMKTTNGSSAKVQLDFNGLIPIEADAGLKTVDGYWRKFTLTLDKTINSSCALSIRLRGTKGTDDTASLLVWCPHQEEGTVLGIQQETNSLNDVTESGAKDCWSLLFDGVDDGLSVNNLNLSTTEAITALAGSKTTSATVNQAILEYSSNADTSVGAFSIKNIGGVANSVDVLASGTTFNTTRFSPYQPNTVVIAGQRVDITKQTTLARVNGVQQQVVKSLGTGLFGNYNLNIGKRADGTLPFSGFFYGAVVVDYCLTGSDNSAFEQVLAKQAGIKL